MNKFAPLVSVYIATHNRAEKLKRAIDSVYYQDYQNIELIVVNDGSVDNTVDILNSYKDRYENFQFYSFKNSRGAPSARNHAIQHSSGEFVTGLDDDDYFRHNRISTFVKLWESKYSFLCSSAICIDKNTEIRTTYGTGIIEWETIKCLNVVDGQIFTKKQNIIDVGSYDESFVAWQDYDLWLRLIKKFGNGYKLSEATYILDISSDTMRISTSSKVFDGYNQFLSKHKADFHPYHKKLLYINYCLNTDTKPTLCKYFTLLHLKTFTRLTRLYIKMYLPQIFKIVRKAFLYFK